jgi:hypothetical protein
MALSAGGAAASAKSRLTPTQFEVASRPMAHAWRKFPVCRRPCACKAGCRGGLARHRDLDPRPGSPTCAGCAQCVGNSRSLTDRARKGSARASESSRCAVHPCERSRAHTKAKGSRGGSDLADLLRPRDRRADRARLEDILSASITKAVMVADGVDPRELAAMLRGLGRAAVLRTAEISSRDRC